MAAYHCVNYDFGNDDLYRHWGTHPRRMQRWHVEPQQAQGGHLLASWRGLQMEVGMNKIIARLKSKTYRAALFGILLSAIEANSGLISGLLPTEYRAWAIMFWPAAMLTLREFTNSALDDK